MIELINTHLAPSDEGAVFAKQKLRERKLKNIDYLSFFTDYPSGKTYGFASSPDKGRQGTQMRSKSPL